MAASTRRPPVVCVHGYSCSADHWAGAPEPLGERFAVRLLSLPGHDGVPLPAGGVLDIGACAEHVIASGASAGMAPVYLVGHSLGGMVGLEAVLRRAELFAGLILVDAFPRLGPPPPFDRSFWPGTPPELKSRVVKGMMAVRRNLPSSLWESVVAFDATPRLPEITVPVRGIYGDRGEGSPSALGERLLSTGLGRLREFEWHLVPQAGHFVMLERPGAFYRLLGEILASLRGR